ncbi:hypothetical protein [Fuerstiella marisgermanici]|nr:hypothetical protein [Fuerstiella marisgermanici]
MNGIKMPQQSRLQRRCIANNGKHIASCGTPPNKGYFYKTAMQRPGSQTTPEVGCRLLSAVEAAAHQ